LAMDLMVWVQKLKTNMLTCEICQKKFARLTPKKTLMGQLETPGTATPTKKGVGLMIF
jgi:hypothetical protein